MNININQSNQKNLINTKYINLVFYKEVILLLLLIFIPIVIISCGSLTGGSGGDEKPQDVQVPDDPIQRAAINGLITSYRESTMWQIQNVKTLGSTPMAPSGELLELQDPKEIYCVCLEYEARYKVTWSTSEGSPWEKTVRNILVIKTQGDQFLAVKPMNICSPFC
jgi:hypothetical protein